MARPDVAVLAPPRRWLVPAIVVAGLAVRIALLPSPGFAGDMDQFVVWAGHIARDGLGHAYDVDISFGPVMAFVWWVLGLIDPAIRLATDGSDPAIRVLMKLPAVAGDLAMAATAWYLLRRRPGWATAAVAVILLHPAIWFLSAWWGTYDSIYAAFAILAVAFVTRGAPVPAAVALMLAVLTKPQAAPLVVPFVAWFLARATRDLRRDEVMRAVRSLLLPLATGMLTLLVLWLPFLAANGPGNYIAGLGRYQSDLYGLLSLNAWNPWWAFQELAAGGNYVQDSAAFIGGLSYRVVGYIGAVLALGIIAASVARRPTPRMLALGVAASALATFELLTTMHERYAFAVIPVLALLLDDRRARWIVGIFGATTFLNLLAASARYVGGLVPLHGPITIAGSAINVAVLAYVLLAMWRDAGRLEPDAAINQADALSGGRMPLDTSAGSAAATSGA